MRGSDIMRGFTPSPVSHLTMRATLSHKGRGQEQTSYSRAVIFADDLNGTLRPTHHRRRQILQRRCAELLHGGAGFEAQHAEHALDAGLTECAEPPEIGPADADRLRAECQGLDDVAAAAKTAVDQDRHPAANPRDDF